MKRFVDERINRLTIKPMPENDTRSDGLFSLLPAPQQEQIRWRLAEDLDELYDALTESLTSARALELSLSRIFRGDEFPT